MYRDHLIDMVAGGPFMVTEGQRVPGKGIEMLYMDAFGAGSNAGSVSSWPFYRCGGIHPRKLKSLYNRIRRKKARLENFEGLDLGDYLIEAQKYDRFDFESISEFLYRLPESGLQPDKPFVCACDLGNFEEHPYFTHSMEAAEKWFRDRYWREYLPWQLMSNHDLWFWLRIREQFDFYHIDMRPDDNPLPPELYLTDK